MREIKFRAWHKESKKMYPVRLIHWIIGKIYGVRLNGYLQKGRSWKRNESGEYDFAKIEEIFLMQYTGRKDKNDKEIYESDLVKKDGTICEVAWHEKDARFGMKYKDETGEEMFDLMLNDVEIVGNIYENQETRDKA